MKAKPKLHWYKSVLLNHGPIFKPMETSIRIHRLRASRQPWQLKPNPSFKRSPNGGPLGPGWLYAVHFHQPGPGVPPLAPAYLER